MVRFDEVTMLAPTRDSLLVQERVFLGAEIKMSLSLFRPSSRVWMVGNVSKCAFMRPRNARRVSGVAGRCEKKRRGSGAPETYEKLHFLANDAARRRELREFFSPGRTSAHLRKETEVYVGCFRRKCVLFAWVVGHVLKIRTQTESVLQNG